jgi:hypothetical protein
LVFVWILQNESHFSIEFLKNEHAVDQISSIGNGQMVNGQIKAKIYVDVNDAANVS